MTLSVAAITNYKLAMENIIFKFLLNLLRIYQTASSSQKYSVDQLTLRAGVTFGTERECGAPTTLPRWHAARFATHLVKVILSLLLYISIFVIIINIIMIIVHNCLAIKVFKVFNVIGKVFNCLAQ